MRSVDDLMDEVEALLGTLSPKLLAELRRYKGYAFEAFVFVRLGDAFVAEADWDWVHPQPGPMLATTAGGRIADSLHRLSRVTSEHRDLSLVQAVDWRGPSRESHALDIALVGHVDWPLHDRGKFCLHGAIECKNHGRPLSMPAARNMVALRQETKDPCCPFSARSSGPTCLISASDCSPESRNLMAYYEVRSFAPVTPTGPKRWAIKLFHELIGH